MATKILILAGDTDGNLGDLAIVSATCAQLRRLEPNIQISLISSMPGRDRTRLGIVPIARGWRGFLNLIRTTRAADLVICGGGGLFQDDDSLLKMPYWAARLLVLRVFADRIAGFSIGAGPLEHASSRFFARLALKVLNPITVRDEYAMSALRPLTKRDIKVVPDPAFLLQPADQSVARDLFDDAGVPADGTPLLGVSVRRWFHNNSNLVPYKYAAKLGLRRGAGQQKMNVFIERLATVIDRVQSATNTHVVFLPTYDTSLENDAAVCASIANKMQSDDYSIVRLDDPATYKSATGLLSAMLCGRMHSAVLAAGSGTPVIGLAYNQKFFGTFSLLQQQQRCISLASFVNEDRSEELAGMILDTIRHPDDVRPDTANLEYLAGQFVQCLLAGAAGTTNSSRATQRQAGS